ncbi:NADH-quinone oxidoreductase subunit K [Thiocapsa bogorovii]|uniref:NADH-quinone oxidoreductase subunit K n=1 Tax=Thiocapsa bogorovii TaxID=521689 RepID=UPI001E3007EC|nr:NADH-quinone oxidoreductase subunit K [Thiocapsa bogorovii]UHD16612.1 NADH-quinone oxidoreductase subunit K [Thiocapsa bogorovii]
MTNQVLFAQLLYGGSGILLILLGLWSFLVHAPLLRKLIAINVMGAGVFHILVAIAYRGIETPPDPVPHALVLTGIVVAVSATALALAFGKRLDQDADPG